MRMTAVQSRSSTFCDIEFPLCLDSLRVKKLIHFSLRSMTLARTSSFLWGQQLSFFEAWNVLCRGSFVYAARTRLRSRFEKVASLQSIMLSAFTKYTYCAVPVHAIMCSNSWECLNNLEENKRGRMTWIIPSQGHRWYCYKSYKFA